MLKSQFPFITNILKLSISIIKKYFILSIYGPEKYPKILVRQEYLKIDGYLYARISPSSVRYITSMGKQMKYKNKMLKLSQEIDYHRLLKHLDEKWLTIHVIEGKYPSYWQLINDKERVVIVLQTGPRPSPIHYQRGIYVYMMNYYAIYQSYTVTS